MSFNLFSTIFLEKLPSTKSLYISLAILFFSGCVCCIFARIHDLYWAELFPKDRLITTWGCYVSLMCFVGASAIPCAPIRAAIIAIYTVCGSSNEHRAAAQIEQPLTIEEVILLPPRIEKNVVSLAGPVLQNTTDNQVALYPNDNPALTQETKLPVNGNTAETKRKSTHKKPLPVSIDHEGFKNVFALHYVKKYPNEYKDIISGLETKQWTKTELCKIALLIQQSQILKTQYKNYREWVREFFRLMGRDDCPKLANRNDYIDFNKSTDDISYYFHTLTSRYNKTEDSMLILTDKAKQLC